MNRNDTKEKLYISEVQSTLLSALAAFCNGEHFLAPENTSWNSLLKESTAHAVVLPCIQGLEPKSIPMPFRKSWSSCSARSLQANIQVQTYHNYTHKLLKENKIEYVVLKGSASAFYYPDPMMRSMGDVDFLVREEDLARATELLQKNGFAKWQENHACHVVFQKEKMHLEMHFAPAGMPNRQLGEIIRSYLNDVFSTSTEVAFCENTIQKPSDFHHGLFILMHTYHHLFAEGIGLRHLCDWAVFINRFSSEEFHSLFFEKLNAVGLWRFAQIMGGVCHQYLSIPWRSWMGEITEQLCNAVICDILAGGNFGYKDSERKTQGIVISSRGKNGIGKSNLIQLFRSANEAGKNRYSRLAKIPVLNRFCFVPIGFRYVFRVLTGKRKRLKIVGNLRSIEERKKLYKEFHLFEVEECK